MAYDRLPGGWLEGCITSRPGTSAGSTCPLGWHLKLPMGQVPLGLVPYGADTSAAACGPMVNHAPFAIWHAKGVPERRPTSCVRSVKAVR